jgi:YD repeat-containing protein
MEMGRYWLHSLDWAINRPTSSSGEGTVLVVRRPLNTVVAIFKLTGSSDYETSALRRATVEEASGHVTFVDDDGTRVTFGSGDVLEKIEPPNEAPIVVTHGTNSKTFTRGTSSITITYYGSGHATHPGKIASVAANGETWSYDYNTDQALVEVIGPDPYTLDPVTTTYTYTGQGSGYLGRLAKVERTVGSTTTELGDWGFTGDRVTSADERALDAELTLEYDFGSSPASTTVKHGTSVLATFDHEEGRIVETTGLGGLGVNVPYRTTTFDASVPTSRFKTQTDLDGNTTLFEDYVANGAPSRIVEGWEDSTNDGGVGVFSSGDTYTRLREFTWHPKLLEPLTVHEKSPLTNNLYLSTTYDYGTPPGDRLQQIVRTGKTLNAAGAAADFTYTTEFTYVNAPDNHANGQIETIKGPRASNFTKYVYDSESGFRTAAQRYLDGPTSAHLDTLYADFDARGHPETVTDPNGRVTTFTYDMVGRVKTATPPWSGTGTSTVTFTYDVDGNLTRVDFPDDSFGQDHFLRMGYDEKLRPTFIAESNGDAIVYEYTDGRPTRQSLHQGFVNLSTPGTV